MTAPSHARRRVGGRLTRSTSSKDKLAPGALGFADQTKEHDNIPVPNDATTNPAQSRIGPISPPSPASSASSALSPYPSETEKQDPAGGDSNELDDIFATPITPYDTPLSPVEEAARGGGLYGAVCTPARSTFSSSVASSKRKASTTEIDPNHLRRSVRARADVSPFRLDTTEAQRDSTLFISQPQTPSKAYSANASRRDSMLFKSLPASLSTMGDITYRANGHGGNSFAAQYPPLPSANPTLNLFDISLLTTPAGNEMSSFQPANAAPATSTPTNSKFMAFDKMMNDGSFSDPADLSFSDFLKFDDVSAPFANTPEAAFMTLPQTPKFANIPGVRTASSQMASSRSAGFNVSGRSQQQQKPSQGRNVTAAANAGQSRLREDNVPTSSVPIRPLPKRAARHNVSAPSPQPDDDDVSDTGSIVDKGSDADEEEDDDDDDDGGEDDIEGDDDYQDEGSNDYMDSAKHRRPVEDDQFALYASQVRRKAEALSLKSSVGPSDKQKSPIHFDPPSSPTPAVSSARNRGKLANANEARKNAQLESFGDFMEAQQSSAPDLDRANSGQSVSVPLRVNLDGHNVLLDLPLLTSIPPMPVPAAGSVGFWPQEQQVSSNATASGPSCSPDAPDKKKRRFHNKQTGHVPRPSNSFMLYRSDKIRELNARKDIQIPQKELSKAVGWYWRHETQEVKDKYAAKAALAKEEHEQANPGYAYRPNRKKRTSSEAPASSSTPLKRSTSALPPPPSENRLSKSVPASMISSAVLLPNTSGDIPVPFQVDDGDSLPTPASPTARNLPKAHTPASQSFIPVPSSAARPASSKTVGGTLVTPRRAVPARQSSIPASVHRQTRHPAQAAAIVENAESFAAQRGLRQSQIVASPSKGSSQGLVRAQSSPTKVNVGASNTTAHTNRLNTPMGRGVQSKTPSVAMQQQQQQPRYAQATSASMSRATTYPLQASSLSTSSAAGALSQYTTFGHLQHPMPQAQNNILNRMAPSTPSNAKARQFAELVTPPSPALNRHVALDHRSLAPQGSLQTNMQIPRTSTGLSNHASQAPNAALPSSAASHSVDMPAFEGIPDGFVVNGRLYPSMEAAQAMAAAAAAAGQITSQPSARRIPSDRSVLSTGPVQEILVGPAHQTFQQYQTIMDPGTFTGNTANPFLAVEADGQQYLYFDQPLTSSSNGYWDPNSALLSSTMPYTGQQQAFYPNSAMNMAYSHSALPTPNTALSTFTNAPTSAAHPGYRQSTAGESLTFYADPTNVPHENTGPVFFMNEGQYTNHFDHSISEVKQQATGNASVPASGVALQSSS